MQHVHALGILVSNSFSLFGLLAPLCFFPILRESGGQEGGGGMCSAELVFPDTTMEVLGYCVVFFTRTGGSTSGRGTFGFRTLMHQ